MLLCVCPCGGGGELDVRGDGQVVRYMKIDVGEFLDCETGGADLIHGVAMVVSGEVDMLSKIEAVQ